MPRSLTLGKMEKRPRRGDQDPTGGRRSDAETQETDPPGTSAWSWPRWSQAVHRGPRRPGWRRSATNSRAAGPYVGYELHLAVQASDVRWTNGVDRTVLCDEVPDVVTCFSLVPAGTQRRWRGGNASPSALRRGCRSPTPPVEYVAAMVPLVLVAIACLSVSYVIWRAGPRRARVRPAPDRVRALFLSTRIVIRLRLGHPNGRRAAHPLRTEKVSQPPDGL
jgi:hypothetical protein